MPQKEVPRYNPTEYSLALAGLLTTLFFKLRDHGLSVELDGESLEVLGKLLYTLTVKIEAAS